MAIIQLSVEVPRRQVLRLLGYPRSKEPTPRVAKRLEELLPLCRELTRPAGSLHIVDGHTAEAAGVEARSPLVGLGLCTIGPGLEAEQQRCSDGDALLDALILDSYGSAAAEAAADALNFHLCQEARTLGHHAGARSSPGYGSWEISNQGPLLALLDADGLGVSLTPSMLMIPRKSVSFAARLRPGERSDPESRVRRCARCAMKGCAYREEETTS